MFTMKGTLAVSTVVLSLAWVGCGGSAQPPKSLAAAPLPPPPPTAAQPSATPVVPDSDKSATVRISDEIVAACGLQKHDAFFAFDSSRLTDADRKVLSDLATCFTTGPLKGRTMKLVGRADPRGETEYNFVLGQSRADAVAQFLQTKNLERARIATSSRGSMDATGHDEHGWAEDRRVDIMLQ